MTLASMLSIARSALLAQQRAMDVTSHNVANAQTAGYSRQRLLMSATYQTTPLGMMGRDVTVDGITRARDRFADAMYRRESGLYGDASTMRDTLSDVESVLNEPSDSGVGAALDGLFTSFSDLANDPASATNRTLVQQAATRFVQRLHQLDSDVSSATDDAVAKLRSQVDELNGLTAKIADYNKQILSAQASGTQAPDLQDQRDQLVDQLSGLVGVRVLERGDGTIGVMAGDTLVADGATAQTLEVRALAGGGFALAVAGGGPQVDPGGGSVGALTRLVSTTLPGLRQQLDTLARNVVVEVNAIHRTGYTLGGATGTDFFSPTGVTANSIALTAAVAASGDAIAAGGTATPGDGAVALQLAALARTGITALGGRTLRGYFTDVAAGVGTGVSDASQNADAYQTMVDAADTSRASTSGVSVDEEMVSLISQQQAYAAASRLVKAADEMMQAIIDMM